ncbi:MULTISPECIES: outer membrane lipoprotein-sorting protein [unclassified Aliivibrio]|uniref:outer membrane lipoprotein-sorting protein n=1 Tax=unclassified Aliivibrio TaxID=2645654 RepID=UPI00080EBA01|nr:MULTISPECIES: outer membrane lipoprotein-sorting protein [unclassified Aliivibrio]OCH13747.1 outer membrane lipoprotein-sorting protein [Aliivibrio sp. 1S165]OCH23794.1 outer membrane lipoprotein-sorting protein [Aliivibrio sp. 1S128]OCH31611.1 outer membrane lipoprotein-sorting protein [Aliivibrio sp. 1S175]
MSKLKLLPTLFLLIGFQSPVVATELDQPTINQQELTQPEKEIRDSQIKQMIKAADDYRLDNAAAKVVSEVLLYKNNELDKTRQYTVYMRENRESLVLFNSQVEAGQKMLMLGDNYWLLMPKSRRPIRITPMQKLLGEASVGDISTLTWSDDYQGQWQLSESLTLENGKQVQTEKLKLNAITKGASYFTIDLWLEQGTHFPIKADLYLRSGRMAKEAWFIKGIREGETKVISMVLNDRIQTNQKTVIEYKEIVPTDIADKYYNPAYLSRTKQLDL